MLETLQRWLKRIGLGGLAVILIAYAILLAYSLPHTMTARVMGTEVQRKSVEQKDGTVRSQDIRYVIVEDLEGESHMLRNVDTGWGWPPYFKFDSGDIAAQSTTLAADGHGETVLLRYYGFRVRLFSAFPNILSLEVVDEDHRAIPWFVIVFLALHVLFIAVATVWLRTNREPID